MGYEDYGDYGYERYYRSGERRKSMRELLDAEAEHRDQQRKLDMIRMKERHTPMAPNISAIREQVQKQLLALATLQAIEDRFPNQPPERSVLQWIVTHGSGKNAHEYVYVGLHTPAGWYVTGEHGGRVMQWDELRQEIGSKPCHLAVGWEEIPRPEGSAADSETDPAKWFDLVYPNKQLPAGPSAKDETGADVEVTEEP